MLEREGDAAVQQARVDKEETGNGLRNRKKTMRGVNVMHVYTRGHKCVNSRNCDVQKYSCRQKKNSFPTTPTYIRHHSSEKTRRESLLSKRPEILSAEIETCCTGFR